VTAAANRGNRLQTPELVQELTDKNNGVAPTPLELQQAANSKQSSIACEVILWRVWWWWLL
jgi:hypothetical protein